MILNKLFFDSGKIFGFSQCKVGFGYLKSARISLKMFRKRCAWWSRKTRVGRKRTDRFPLPPNTTPEGREKRRKLQIQLSLITQDIMKAFDTKI